MVCNITSDAVSIPHFGESSYNITGMIEMREKETYLDLCLGMDSPWPIVCGAEIHVGLSPHYPSKLVSV